MIIKLAKILLIQLIVHIFILISISVIFAMLSQRPLIIYWNALYIFLVSILINVEYVNKNKKFNQGKFTDPKQMHTFSINTGLDETFNSFLKYLELSGAKITKASIEKRMIKATITLMPKINIRVYILIKLIEDSSTTTKVQYECAPQIRYSFYDYGACEEYSKKFMNEVHNILQVPQENH